MLDLDPKTIEADALRELEAETHRTLVDAAKERLRERRGRPWWKHILPRITIEWNQ